MQKRREVEKWVLPYLIRSFPDDKKDLKPAVRHEPSHKKM